MTRMLPDVTEMSRPHREGSDPIAGTPRRTWGSAMARRVARALLLALPVVMASACVVPWNVERDEPAPNSPPIFDYEGTTPKIGDDVPVNGPQFFQPTIVARDADLGDTLTARLFADIGATKYFYFAQEFRLVPEAIPTPGTTPRRIGQPLQLVNYCGASMASTVMVRVVVTDGTFLNNFGEQHKVASGATIEGNWRILCN